MQQNERHQHQGQQDILYLFVLKAIRTLSGPKKIQINGKKAAPHIFLDNVNIQVNKDAKTPAIELHGKGVGVSVLYQPGQ